jgi:hypothetical protein
MYVYLVNSTKSTLTKLACHVKVLGSSLQDIVRVQRWLSFNLQNLCGHDTTLLAPITKLIF